MPGMCANVRNPETEYCRFSEKEREREFGAWDGVLAIGNGA